VAARQLGSHAAAITTHVDPGTAGPENQATTSVVHAISAQLTAINAVLASRIEATAAKLEVAGHHYAAGDHLTTEDLTE